MKYEIADGVKEHNFWCVGRMNFTNYRKCKRYCKCYSLECWKRKLMDDLKTDCHVENETNAEGYLTCPSCGKKSILSAGRDKYFCFDCGFGFSLDDDERREVMGDDFVELDEKDVARQLREIR